MAALANPLKVRSRWRRPQHHETTCAENVLVDNLANPTIFVSAGGQFGTAVLWFKHGPAPTDWRSL